MQPNEWLALVGKHIQAPQDLSQEELAKLRTNYTVWKLALDHFSANAYHDFTMRIKVLFPGQHPTEVWSDIRLGLCPEDTPEDVKIKYQDVFGEYRTFREAFMKANATRQFLAAFDQNVIDNTNAPPHEVQEVLWRQKAELLAQAIQEHRRGHVVANKQPNGMDFHLWSVVDLDEFFPSVHAELQQRGHITFRE